MQNISKTILICSICITIFILFFIGSNGKVINYFDINSSNFANSSAIEQPIYDYESITNGEPISYPVSFNDTNVNVKFILYEDFPIKVKSQIPVTFFKLGDLPDDNWGKFIPIGDHGNNQSTILRLMGSIRPLISTPFNNTLFVMGKQDNTGSLAVSSIPIIRNKIITEISPVRESVPIKFKNEIFTKENSNFFYIYGVVYDPSVNSVNVKNTSGLKIDIEPIGMMYNGSLIKLPSWIAVKTLRVALYLKQYQPDYYVLSVSTNNAPSGSYEIALRENIQGTVFIETATITVRGS